MKMVVLTSSSSGNSVYLEANGYNILLDAGISAKGMLDRLKSRGVYIDHLDFIFITHEHYDHVSGLASLYKKFEPTIYITRKTYSGLSESIKDKVSPVAFKFIKAEEEFDLNGLKVLPFKTSHDANDSVGYRFMLNEKKLVYLTDTGNFSVREDLMNAECYIMESNHEPDMLSLSGRPWMLIQRILSDEGHLSNQRSAELFASLMGDKTKTVFLYHLSSECNTKELAKMAYESYFKKHKLSLENIKMIITDKTIPTELVEI